MTQAKNLSLLQNVANVNLPENKNFNKHGNYFRDCLLTTVHPPDYLPMVSAVIITRGQVQPTLNLVMTLGILMIVA